jgi:hypothetical protein
MIHYFKSKRDLFILKFIFFLFVLLILDFVAGNTLKYLYFKQNSGWLYRTTYAIDNTNANILIFGASRANHHYCTNLFEDRLKISTYNTGRDGNAIFYHYGILKSILKRHTPKIAILDFSHGEFKLNQDSYDRISSLLPYNDSHPELRSIIQLKSKYESYKLLSKIYPYNSLIFQITAGNLKSNRTRMNRNDFNGYVPLSQTWKGSIVHEKKFANYIIDTLKVHYFNLFVEDCINYGIKLYIILSPTFVKYEGNDLSISIAKKIALSHNIPFIDFSKDIEFLTQPFIYADESHLNDTGAKLYTSKVIKILQPDISSIFNSKKLLLH